MGAACRSDSSVSTAGCPCGWCGDSCAGLVSYVHVLTTGNARGAWFRVQGAVVNSHCWCRTTAAAATLALPLGVVRFAQVQLTGDVC